MNNNIRPIGLSHIPLMVWDSTTVQDTLIEVGCLELELCFN
jgi:hypothetical protein